MAVFVQAAEQESASCSESCSVPLGSALLQAAAPLPLCLSSQPRWRVQQGCTRAVVLVCPVLGLPVSGCVSISSCVDSRLAQLKGQWSLGCRSFSWAHPAVCTLWPGDGGPHRHRKQRRWTHNLGKTKPDCHHHTYSSPAFTTGTAASHALFGLLCVWWRN